VVGYTREWERGTFFITGEKKKKKKFLFCLPIIPAYLPLKFRNGQFLPKTPGPISPTTLEQNKKKQKKIKKNLHVGSTRGWERGTFFERAKNLKTSNYVCQSYLRIFP
jgi:hypothetical protein